MVEWAIVFARGAGETERREVAGEGLSSACDDWQDFVKQSFLHPRSGSCGNQVALSQRTLTLTKRWRWFK